MHAKIHERRNPRSGDVRRVVAACDSHLLGKVFGAGKGRGAGEVVLDLKTYRRFYDGKKVSEKELEKILESAENLNLVGEQVIKVAARVLPLEASKARKIGGVPHLQHYKI